MKLTVITILAISFLGCNNPGSQQSPGQTQATLVVDSSKKDKIVGACDFDCFIKDPQIPELARNIYLGKEWQLNKDDEVLALLDSLNATNKAARAFYFKVVTLSYPKADGYYSEGLGLAAYTFIIDHTQEFATYFDHAACHTPSDLEDWANMVVWELAISREGEYEQALVEEFMKKTEAGYKNCTANQKETMKRFGVLLKEKWKAYFIGDK